MSTPTTAVATLPHYHPHHYPHPHPHAHSTYAHSHHQGHQPGVSANYRSTATGPANNNTSSSHHSSHNHNTNGYLTSNVASSLTPATADSSLPSLTAITNTAGRVPSGYHQSSNAGYHSPLNGAAQHQSSPAPRPPPHGQQLHNHNHEPLNKYSTNGSNGRLSDHDSQSGAAGMAEPTRKRRRSRAPDWQDFYRNGLPSEIIVIDSSEEPEANTGRKITNGTSNNANPTNTNTTLSNSSATRQPPNKRRRRDDDVTAASTGGAGYTIQHVGSNNNTPAGSANSTDRTSALNTTAPTSLSSQSQYDDSQGTLKRKRTTRQQAANEAKRRDTDVLGNRCFTYKPPPYPPKKAPDVHVRVVQDVSFQHSR